MNILLINQPLGNRGDESAHRALIRSILERFPDVNVRVLFVDCYSVWSVEQYDLHDDRVKYVNIHSTRAYGFVGRKSLIRKHFCGILREFHPTTRALLKYYRWADAVVCAPGGINMGGFQDWAHLFLLELARYAKKPLAYYGRSFGPFPKESTDNIKFYNLSNQLLHYFAYLSIRDHKTAILAKEMNLHYVETVDTAFLDSPDIVLPYEIRHTLGKPYTVFVPNELLWHYAYRDKIDRAELIDFYGNIAKDILRSNKDMHIVMLPQLYATWHLDVNFFRDIADYISDDRVIVLPDCYSSDIQQTIIRDASLLIGARYHSIVFAINQNVPFLALSYEHKISGLLETLGKSDVCIDISNAILTKEGREKCLAEVTKLLPNVQSDNMAQGRAKQIAKDGFESFVQFLNGI